LPAKAIPEMTYTVSGETLNPTHSLTHCYLAETHMLHQALAGWYPIYLIRSNGRPCWPQQLVICWNG